MFPTYGAENPDCFLLLRLNRTSQEKMAQFGGHVNLLFHPPLPSFFSTCLHTHSAPASYPLPVEAWMRLKAAM